MEETVSWKSYDGKNETSLPFFLGPAAPKPAQTVRPSNCNTVQNNVINIVSRPNCMQNPFKSIGCRRL